MSQHEHIPFRRYAVAFVASARRTLRDLSASSTWLRLVTPTILEVAFVVALVLFHVLPGLLGALGAQVGGHG